MFSFEKIIAPVDDTLKGIAAHFSKKIEEIGQGYYRNFILSPSEKITMINDIYVDSCFEVAEMNSVSAPSHSLEIGSQLEETSIRKPLELSLNCQFSSNDHKEKYEKLLKLLGKGQTITLLLNGKVYNNLTVLSVSKNVTNIYYTNFSITMKELKYVKLGVIPAPEAEKIIKLSTEQATGKENNNEIPDFISLYEK